MDADVALTLLYEDLVDWPRAVDRQALATVLAEVESLRAAVARIRALHQPWSMPNQPTICETCPSEQGWPCETNRALDGKA